MRPDDRVLVDDRFAPLNATSGGSGGDLLQAGVPGFETVKPLPEQGAQTLVCLYRIYEERIAARIWPVEDVEEGGAGGLFLVRDVRVPGH